MTIPRFLYLLRLALITTISLYATLQLPSLIFGASDFSPIPSLPTLIAQLVLVSVIAVLWYYWVARKPWYKRHKVKIGVLVYLVLVALAIGVLFSGLYQEGWLIVLGLVFLTSSLLRNAVYFHKFKRHKTRNT